jgi:hypothetical protein
LAEEEPVAEEEPLAEEETLAKEETLAEEECSAHLTDTPSVVTDATVQDEPTYCFCKEVIIGYIFNIFSKSNSNLPLGRTW